MDQAKISGLFPVLATPFTHDGGLDPQGFARVAGYAWDCGVDGIVFPGMASEAPSLAMEERRVLLPIVQQTAKGRTWIMGASAPDPAQVGVNAALGAEHGASLAMVMAPKAIGHDLERQVEFFKGVAKESGLPIMLQNAPSPFGAGLSVELELAIIKAVPQVRYIKEETMPCGQRVGRLLASAPDSLAGVMGGAGGRYLMDELNRGSMGTMPACELCELHAALIAAWRAGDKAGARRIYNRSMPLLSYQAVFRMALTKEVLKRRGLIESTYVRETNPALDAGDLAEIDAMLSDLQDLLLPPLGILNQ